MHSGKATSFLGTQTRSELLKITSIYVPVCFPRPLTGRWYIREGWLNVVLPKGAEAKPKMFFLFSDMLLQAKRCSALHPTNGDKLEGQHSYPLQDCTMEKVFGHTKSRGGLLSVSISQLGPYMPA